MRSRRPRLARPKALDVGCHKILWYQCLIVPAYCCYLLAVMLSKTELLPARDRLKEADRHLAYVKAGLKHIKRVEDKQIVNDLVGAIEDQQKAIEQMLQVLDTVARCDFHRTQVQGTNGTAPQANGAGPQTTEAVSQANGTKQERPTRLRHEIDDSAQFYLDVSTDETPLGSDRARGGRGLPNGKTGKADRL